MRRSITEQNSTGNSSLKTRQERVFGVKRALKDISLRELTVAEVESLAVYFELVEEGSVGKVPLRKLIKALERKLHSSD